MLEQPAATSLTQFELSLHDRCLIGTLLLRLLHPLRSTLEKAGDKLLSQVHFDFKSDLAIKSLQS